eukprot:TRINITY_DN2242_c0_g1_i1.p1 TRINITY_DN2242_c0_g1~~TRINITY_DN2242_c0_g1_i1.p1  ORF type:complete len:249 (-),score=55.80 TRINITY_DN2242_c0_g1_i1:244-990(-)
MFVNQKGIQFYPESEADKASGLAFKPKNPMVLLEEANRKLMDELKAVKKENNYLKDKVKVLQELLVMKDTRRSSIKPAEFSMNGESSIDFSFLKQDTPQEFSPFFSSPTQNSPLPTFSPITAQQQQNPPIKEPPQPVQTTSHFFLNFVVIVVSLYTRRKLFCAERNCENLERKMERMKSATVSLVDEFTKDFKLWGEDWKQTNRDTSKRVNDLMRLLREFKKQEKSISQKSNASYAIEESFDTQFSIE